MRGSVFDEESGQAHDSPHSNKTDDLAQKIENPQLSPYHTNVQQQRKKKWCIMLSNICPILIQKKRGVERIYTAPKIYYSL
jgi:hypothetical protein